MMIKFNNTYAKLPERFYTRVQPVPVKNPQLVSYNFSLANDLGIDLQSFDSKELAELFSGNKMIEGSEPLALVYAGHQFGHFVPQLGDGRAILLGEVRDKNDAQRDIQLKGSGKTPYSRQGDGRAALGPMIREYIVSEAMHALGIKTTRSLAMVTTGEPVFRETVLPGAILTRIAASHIRIGTFEYFTSQGDLEAIKLLADYVIQRHYPKAKDTSHPYQSLLEEMRDTQASLIADWMRVGFIHGVMNTDNTALSGETIDYGPCAFMDDYHTDKVFSSIDYYGRYAFNNQAQICLWNLIQLAQSLAFLIDPNPKKFKEVLHKLIYSFKDKYNAEWLKKMGQKIGMMNAQEKDQPLLQELLDTMQKDASDYTLTFRYLIYVIDFLRNAPCAANGVNFERSLINQTLWPFSDMFNPSQRLNQWIEKWLIRLQEQEALLDRVHQLMSTVNPAFIPRNHQLEKVIQSAVKHQDFSKMCTLLTVLSSPYKEQKDAREYMRAPAIQERITQTFCGT